MSVPATARPGTVVPAATPVALPLGGTRRAVLDLLKRRPGSTAPVLAEALEVTGNAVRQHLDSLSEAGLVESRVRAATGPGRPPLGWHLTPAAGPLFPDSHAELSVALLDAIGSELGAEALDRVVAARVAAQESSYRAEMPTGGGLRTQVEALARRRSAEGYEADVLDDDGDLLLVERHCPIGAAARSCAGLCSGELELFRRIMGDDVTVERSAHVLAGDPTCAYRIRLSRPGGEP